MSVIKEISLLVKKAQQFSPKAQFHTPYEMDILNRNLTTPDAKGLLRARKIIHSKRKAFESINFNPKVMIQNINDTINQQKLMNQM